VATGQVAPSLSKTMIASHPKSKPQVATDVAKTNQFRRLKSNELVSRGDFVADSHHGFQLWEGPTGFRADSFVKGIYRRHERQPPDAKK